MDKKRFGIVVAKFNGHITTRLLSSCLKTLKRTGIREKDFQVVHVPGSYEIPWAAQEMALSGGFKAIICLGAIIQGRTPQNFFLSQACANALQQVSLKTRIPCIFGIITPKNEAQAIARTRGKLDRGKEAALVALEMSKKWD